jgi:hypothetical protein
MVLIRVPLRPSPQVSVNNREQLLAILPCLQGVDGPGRRVKTCRSHYATGSTRATSILSASGLGTLLLVDTPSHSSPTRSPLGVKHTHTGYPSRNGLRVNF